MEESEEGERERMQLLKRERDSKIYRENVTIGEREGRREQERERKLRVRERE